MNQNSAFLGQGWSFPPQFDVRTRQVLLVSEEEDIRESLRILLGTAPGERTMNPTYGCGLKGLVFEELDESLITEIRDLVARAVLFFEPRIDLDPVEVDVADVYEGRLTLMLDYTIRETNSRSNLVYPFYHREATAAPV